MSFRGCVAICGVILAVWHGTTTAAVSYSNAYVIFQNATVKVTCSGDGIWGATTEGGIRERYTVGPGTVFYDRADNGKQIADLKMLSDGNVQPISGPPLSFDTAASYRRSIIRLRTACQTVMDQVEKENLKVGETSDKNGKFTVVSSAEPPNEARMPVFGQRLKLPPDMPRLRM